MTVRINYDGLVKERKCSIRKRTAKEAYYYGPGLAAVWQEKTGRCSTPIKRIGRGKYKEIAL